MIRSSTGVESSAAMSQNSKSLVNISHQPKLKKRKKKSLLAAQPDRDASHKDHHKVDCGAWGCTCKNKPKAQPKPTESRRRIPTAPINYLPPRHPKINKIQTQFPKLYRWDQQQLQRLKKGEITQEEYVKERDANFADVLDDEDEIKGR